MPRPGGRVPAEARSRLVHAQLARVVEAEDLDPPKCARTARGTPPGGTRGRATGCPSARRPAARASGRSASRRTRRRPARRVARKRSSTAPGSWTCSIVCRNTTRRRRRARSRPSCARSARCACTARRACSYASGLASTPTTARPSRAARPRRSPRRRPCRRPSAGTRPRSTRRRRGGAGTSSSPPARRAACARRSAPAAGRPAAGRAGGRARVGGHGGALDGTALKLINIPGPEATARRYALAVALVRDFPLFPLGPRRPAERAGSAAHLRGALQDDDGAGSSRRRGEFGIVWVSDDGLRPVGCACEIAEVLERMPDGRLNLVARGTRCVPDRGAPGGARLPGQHRSSSSTTAPRTPDREAAAESFMTLYAELVEQATDRTPDRDEIGAMSSLRDGGDGRVRDGGEAGPARPAVGDRPPEARDAAVPRRRSSGSTSSKGRRRAPARTARSTSAADRQLAGSLSAPSTAVDPLDLARSRPRVGALVIALPPGLRHGATAGVAGGRRSRRDGRRRGGRCGAAPLAPTFGSAPASSRSRARPRSRPTAASGVQRPHAHRVRRLGVRGRRPPRSARGSGGRSAEKSRRSGAR